MSYQISGDLSYPCRILVLNESDWTLESNTEESLGEFNVGSLTSGTKTIIAFESGSGETLGYGSVTPIEIPE